MSEKDLFNSVKKEHIFQAILEFENRGVPDGMRDALHYDLIIEDKKYSPKVIMAYANEIATGVLDTKFHGGPNTSSFKKLKELGFEVKKKEKWENDPRVLLIEKYKNLIREKGLKDEVYKWEFVAMYKGFLDDSELISQRIQEVKWTNAIYHMSVATLKGVAKSSPLEVQLLIDTLKNEGLSLNERIDLFIGQFKTFYLEDGGKNSAQQDERSISNYLTIINPEKYTFYKYSYYQKYCDYIGIKTKGKNRKLVHYYQLLDELITNYISEDEELIELVKNEIPDYYDGSNHLILAQDILYEVLDRERIVENYWIFQGNPDTYDFKNAISEKGIHDWNVTAHKTKIHEGDKGIIWLTGKNAGVYGLIEVLSEPRERGGDDDPNWKKEHKADYVVDIEIQHNLFSNPILFEEIKENPKLKNLNVGHQGTNFTASKEEYDEIFNLISKRMNDKKYWIYQPGEGAKYWEQFYNEGILGLGWWQLGDLRQYKSKDEIREKLIEIDGSEGSRKNDTTANWEFVHEMKEGDVVIVKKGISELLGYGEITSDYYFEEEAEFQPSRRKVKWLKKASWSSGKKLVVKTLTDITQYESDTSEYQWYYQYLLAQMGELKQLSSNKNMKQPLNQILYGPPGTGKTWYLQNHYFSNYTTMEESVTAEQHFNDVVQDLSWWQVIGIALIEDGIQKVSEIRENRWVARKAAISESKNERATIWGSLQMHTVTESETVNYKQRQPPLIFDKKQDKKWQILEEEAKETAPELYEILDSVNNFNPQKGKSLKRYEFVTFHQSYSYEDFIEGIKPVMADEGTESEDLKYEIKSGIFKELCKRAESDPENNYALFIDEINRGNVSAIFGELITLIEDDKRKGMENQVTLVLPYSRLKFSVPQNLHIIGTMNTADRSVEALDTALRRRFTFKEMMPNPELLKEKEVGGISLQKILETINERVEMLIDRDHTIGHSYFINLQESKQALADAFNDKIIPLLQEYFYGDYGKIGLVLGKGFVSFKKAKNDVFADFSYENSTDFISNSYELKKVDETTIIEALKELLGEAQKEDQAD
ncbi:MAG: EVE domain-containing protein [Crocinitomicaceae bacterium]|nr:EVE domain-containing protein [Crocinitomicaceae bacterium]